MPDEPTSPEEAGLPAETGSLGPTSQPDTLNGIPLPSVSDGENFERSVLGVGLSATQVPIGRFSTSGDLTSSAGAAAGDSNPTRRANEIILEKEAWKEKLRKLGVLLPSEVDRICSNDRRTRFLVKDMLPVQSIAIVAGESTIGKSPLLCQLALCVASGIPFLGMATERSGVLYLDLENDLYDSQGIRDALVKHLQLGKAPDDFLLVTEPPTDLEEYVREVQPQLVIIDSLRAFRPDITDKNSNAAQWLKDIRRLSRKYRCAFLIVHHLRKPSQSVVSLAGMVSGTGRLEDCKATEWLQRMEGPRALVNQTDVRIAIVEGDLKPAALKMKWSRRVYGDSPLMAVERVLDEAEDPLGYRQLTGVEHLSLERKEALNKLLPDFSTKEAKAALNRSDDPTNKFLQECKNLGLVEKVSKGQWRKLPGSWW